LINFESAGSPPSGIENLQLKAGKIGKRRAIKGVKPAIFVSSLILALFVFSFLTTVLKGSLISSRLSTFLVFCVGLPILIDGLTNLIL